MCNQSTGNALRQLKSCHLLNNCKDIAVEKTSNTQWPCSSLKVIGNDDSIGTSHCLLVVCSYNVSILHHFEVHVYMYSERNCQLEKFSRFGATFEITLRQNMFSRFDELPTCNRHTDGHTDIYYAYCSFPLLLCFVLLGFWFCYYFMNKDLYRNTYENQRACQ